MNFFVLFAALALSVLLLLGTDYLFPTLLPTRFYPLLWLAFFSVAVIFINLLARMAN